MVILLEKLIGWYIPSRDAFKYAYLVGIIFLGLVLAITFVAETLGSGDSFSIDILGVKTEISYLTVGLMGLVWIDANLYVRRHQRGETNWSYAYTAFVLSIMLLVSVALHELGHTFMASLFSNPIKAAGISWWGAYVQPTNNILLASPIEQILMSAAGPGTDYILFVLATWYVARNQESLKENAVQYFAWVNYILIMYNIVPFVTNTDGGKMLYGVLRLFGVSTNWLDQITFVTGVIICLLYYLYRVATNQKAMHEKLASL